MGWVLLSLLAVIFFCLSAHMFGRALVHGQVHFRSAEYNVMALRVERGYRIFTWGLITFVMLGSFVAAFIEAVKDVF